MPRTSIQKKARVCLLLEQGHSIHSIASMEGIHHSTVSRIGKAYQERGHHEDLLRSGRPIIFGPRDERNIVRCITSGQCETAVDI